MFMCFLHPERPERQQYDDLGLEICMKSNLRDGDALVEHMQSRHIKAWRVIKPDNGLG